MSQPFVGEIRMFAGNFAPADWAFCNGAILPISEYDTLFTLLGTTYGGDGQTTFQLPDLQGRIAMHQGSSFLIGQKAGVESVILTVSQIPSHVHSIAAQGGTGTVQSPAGAVFAGSGAPQYAASSNGISGVALPLNGGSQPHENRMPYLAVSYIISLFGIFPSQN